MADFPLQEGLLRGEDSTVQRPRHSEVRTSETVKVSARSCREPPQGRPARLSRQLAPPAPTPVAPVRAVGRSRRPARQVLRTASTRCPERYRRNAGAVRLNGWSLTNTGTEARFVAFKAGDKTGPLVVVPAGDEKNMLGLDQPFPSGLSVESLTGDGTLIANVFFEVRSDAPPETDEDEPPEEEA